LTSLLTNADAAPSGNGSAMKTTWIRLATLLLFMLPAARADEGMWLFNAPPTKQLQEKYGFTPTAGWLDHLQKASVRFNVGGSGSFVSADGLIITNHHVGADALQKFSDAHHNYLKEGFYAKTQAEEKPCLDLELNVLMTIEDVTARVKAAIKPDMDPTAAVAARRAVIANIEKESNDKTGLRSNVVTLYEGGEYQLYRFKRYTDVRLVFAPEVAIAFFGGDPDNFEYPRYDLDICIFRAYENGQPAHPEQYLKWSSNGSSDHELVFVSGHPGSTSRQNTLDVLADRRDRVLPKTLALLYRRESMLQAFSARSAENARRARDDLFGIQNGRKALEGELAGLLDPELFAKLGTRQADLQHKIEAAGNFPDAMAAYAKIATAQKAIAKVSPVYSYYEGRRLPEAFDSKLFGIARTLVRAAEERPKPNDVRLPEFRESNQPSLELQLFSPEPIYDDFEERKLADSLTALCGEFGENDPLVKRVLAGKGPRERADELIQGTKLKDVAVRKKLYEGGTEALKDFSDPMIELARAIDPTARAARKEVEEQDEVQQQAYAQISKARFALEGASDYPDATFTLRLAFGTVEGYEEGGHAVPPYTDFGGLYQRAAEHDNKPPFDLPPDWIASKDKLDLNTPFDFVCTADIIGGNSGSPVVNKAGEFVGIIFDGNIQSLVLDYVYTDKQARAVSVDSRAIIEALSKVYHAGALVDELTGRGK
jgi:hypothetical protein